MKAKTVLQGVVVIALAILAYYLSLITIFEDEFAMGGTFASASFYPQMIIGTAAILGILLIISAFLGNKGKAASSESAEAVDSADRKKGEATPGSRISFWGAAAALLVYTYLFDKLGYLITTPFLMAALFRLLGIRSWKIIIILAVLSSFLVYGFFSFGVDVLFPRGTLLPDT